MSEGILYHTSFMNTEHSDWIRGIAFYTDEIGILRNRLREVSTRNTRQEVRSEVDHYDNEFAVQERTLAGLRQDIQSHEVLILKNTRELADHLGNSTLAQHDVLRERYITMEKTINELRHTFNRFLAKWM